MASDFPFQNPDLPIDAARRRSGGAADRRREGGADAARGARDRAARDPGLQLVERGAARRRARRHRDGLPAGDRPGGDVERRAAARGRGRDLRRGARQAPRVPAPGRPRHVQGADVLVAQHQHLPRPALGARPRDLRRMPVPDRAAGRRVLPRAAGRRPELPEGRRDAQALRRAQRPRGAAPQLRRRRQREGPARDVPARVRGLHHRGEGREHHGGVQPHQRRAVFGQPDAAREDPARRVGLRRLRGQRLLGDQGLPRAPQGDRDLGAVGGAGGQGGLRPELRLHLRAHPVGGRAGAAARGRHRHLRQAAVPGADAPRHVRPAGARAVGSDSVREERQPRAPRAGAHGGARIDRAAEERRATCCR